jgi:hypothetical protein
MGGNAAWRRTTLERFGLWDECTPIEDEPSLCYRVQAGKRAEEHFLFDPEARMIRRLDIPGGMDKRRLSAAGYGHKVFTFLHNVVGHYFPLRFVALYPAYVALVVVQVMDWLFDDVRARRGPIGRALTAAGFCLSLPALWIWWLGQLGLQRARQGAPPHAPRLEIGDRA